jgi:molecular chaperone DnaK
VEINVLQGEREMAADNKSLGRFQLTDIPSAPRGVPQIEVTFNIDANGIVHVSAKDKGTNKENSIQITGSGNLSDEDIKKAQAEAEANAEADKKRRETVESRNTLENLIYQAEKTLKDAGDKAKLEDKANLETAIKDAKTKVETDDKAQLEEASKNLSEKMQTVGAAMYQQAAEAEGAASADGATDQPKADEPVEGEVVDDKKEEK